MIFFEDLCHSGHFTRKVAALSLATRQAHGFPSLHQLGIVIPNVEKAAADLEMKGFGPFFIAKGSPAYWHEKGQVRRVSGKMGIAYHQNIEIELLEPLEGSAFYDQGLDPDGRAVVHHLGFIVDDVNIRAERMMSAGRGVWVRGQLKTGALKTDFVYMDPNEEDGLIIEFISWKLFGRRIEPGAGIAHTIGRIQKWTGRRCLSL